MTRRSDHCMAAACLTRLRPLFGAGLALAAVALGCDHGQSPEKHTAPSSAARKASSPVPASCCPVAATPLVPITGELALRPVDPAPTPTPPAADAPPRLLVPASWLAGTNSADVVSAVPLVGEAASLQKVPSGLEKSISPLKLEEPGEKRSADTQRRFGHAPDHRWLVGELYYSAVREVWCLHYATALEEDCHGGCVTLVLPAPAACRPGQCVRVRGRLADAATLQPCPEYQVEALEILP